MLRNRTFFSVVRFFHQPEEDADIKIFSGSFASKAKQPDDEAAVFIGEKENGNIDKAKELGRILAEQVLNLSLAEDSAIVVSQKKILYGYVCKKVIEGNCANSVLAQAALGAFLEYIKKVSQSDFDIIQDSVAFTKYLLAEHDRQNTVGSVFAALCQDKNNAELICEGDRLYSEWSADCSKAFDQIAFV